MSRSVPHTITFATDVDRFLDTIPRGQKAKFVADAIRGTEDYLTWCSMKCEE
jgi:hypothetical protein